MLASPSLTKSFSEPEAPGPCPSKRLIAVLGSENLSLRGDSSLIDKRINIWNSSSVSLYLAWCFLAFSIILPSGRFNLEYLSKISCLNFRAFFLIKSDRSLYAAKIAFTTRSSPYFWRSFEITA